MQSLFQRTLIFFSKSDSSPIIFCVSFLHVCLHLGAGIYVQVITYVTAVETSEAIEICLTLFEVRQNACCARWFLRLRNDLEWVRRQRAAVAGRGTETRGQGPGCRRPGPRPAPPSCAHPARARGGAPRGSRGGGAVSLSKRSFVWLKGK